MAGPNARGRRANSLIRSSLPEIEVRASAACGPEPPERLGIAQRADPQTLPLGERIHIVPERALERCFGVDSYESGPGGEADHVAAVAAHGALVVEIVGPMIGQAAGLERVPCAWAGLVGIDAEGDAAVLAGVARAFDQPIEMRRAIGPGVPEQDGSGWRRAIGHVMV